MTRHCNYGRPLALSIRIDHPATRLPARPGGRRACFYFYTPYIPSSYALSLRAARNIEYHPPLSMLHPRFSLLMERTSSVDGSDDEKHVQFCAQYFWCLRYSLWWKTTTLDQASLTWSRNVIYYISLTLFVYIDMCVCRKFFNSDTLLAWHYSI